MSRPGLSDRSYVEQLGAVLRQRDPEALRRFLMARAGEFGDEAQLPRIREQSLLEMEALMHRMTTVRPDLEEFHRESQSWLARYQLEARAKPTAEGQGSKHQPRTSRVRGPISGAGPTPKRASR